MVIEHAAERITAVAQQMPPVGDLNGLRRSLAGALGVGAGPIADDDLDRRMVLEPRGQGLGRAIGQQVDPAPALEITEDRAVVAALAPVINAEHPRRERRLEIADAAQQGRRAMPIRLAMSAPGLPPSVRAMARCEERKRSVWRARQRAMSGRVSPNVRRGQVSLTHRKRRTCTRRMTGQHGRSPRQRQ